MQPSPPPNPDQRRSDLVDTDRVARELHAKKQKRSRIRWIVGAWILVVPMTLVMWSWFRWFAVLFVAAIVWATWDYYRRGGMIDAIEATQRAGAFVPEAFRDE